MAIYFADCHNIIVTTHFSIVSGNKINLIAYIYDVDTDND